VFVADEAGRPLAELYGYLGRATNNVAEYQALLHALRYALGRGAQRVRVFSDSELVVKQLDGRYRVKHPDMQPLHREASALLRKFEQATVSHVRREQNKDADRLANRALDEKASKLD
jgi:ribonuclease HI